MWITIENVSSGVEQYYNQSTTIYYCCSSEIKKQKFTHCTWQADYADRITFPTTLVVISQYHFT